MDVLSFRVKEGGLVDHLKLQNVLSALEKEHPKIEAFKRELPLCMEILTDAIRAIKLCLVSVSSSADSSSKGNSPRTIWKAEPRLWKHPDQVQNATVPDVHLKSSGGAFNSPFNLIKCHERRNQEQEERHMEQPKQLQQHVELLRPAASTTSETFPANQLNCSTSTITSTKSSKKPSRRRWSSELHRRFVAVLEDLGGPYAATPKQIRESMKVEGLTNDEIKSHLQKYRLHIAGKTPASQNQSVFVLGRFWMPAEFAQKEKMLYAIEKSKAT